MAFTNTHGGVYDGQGGAFELWWRFRINAQGLSYGGRASWVKPNPNGMMAAST